jgi:hypothetical protein
MKKTYIKENIIKPLASPCKRSIEFGFAIQLHVPFMIPIEHSYTNTRVVFVQVNSSSQGTSWSEVLPYKGSSMRSSSPRSPLGIGLKTHNLFDIAVEHMETLERLHSNWCA